MMTSYGESDRRAPLKSEGSQAGPDVVARRAAPRERRHLATEVFDSSGVSKRDFETRPIRNPCKNVIQISFRGFRKDDPAQRSARRFFRLSRAIARLEPGKHLVRVDELFVTAGHAIEHRNDRFVEPAFDAASRACRARSPSRMTSLSLA
jgi:hypothetical protein